MLHQIKINLVLLVAFVLLLAACLPDSEVIEVTRVVATAVPPTTTSPTLPLPPTPTMDVAVTAVTPLPTSPAAPIPTLEIMMEDWLTYENEFYGYRFSYPPEATISVQGVTGFPTEELPDGLTSAEYRQQLEDTLPNNICVSVTYRSGFVMFQPGWEAGGKYTVPCGVTGVGDYDVTFVTETLTIDGSNYAAQGSVVRERDETATWHNEFYFIYLDDAFWIQYGSAYGNEAYFREIEETLRRIVMSFTRVEETTAVARATAPFPTNPQTYTNPELGFSLQYGQAWQLAVENYEGSIQLIRFGCDIPCRDV